jgi:hypothetical protein
MPRRRALWSSVAVLGLVVPAAAAGLAFDMPSGWIPAVPSSSMRVAEFVLPRASADQEDASLVVYYFPGGAGSVDANVDRWVGQMTQPDGSPSKAAARRSSLESASGLEITVIDVAGTYIAEVTPGSTERHDKAGFRLRAAVIETAEGPYYVKLVGPQTTVARWDASFQAFLKSMRTRS